MPSPLPAVKAGAALLFGAIARVSGRRFPHPIGVAFHARLVVGEAALPEAELFSLPGEHAAAIRFSRGFGLPDPIPEIIALAIKVPSAYGPEHDQDLLFAATGAPPVARHVFALRRSHLGATYSTVLPMIVGGRRVVFGVAVPPDPAAEGGADLDEVVHAAAGGTLELDLRVATLQGPWRTVGRLAVGARMTAEEERLLCFNSASTGGGIAATGAINDIRGPAYAESHRQRLRGD